MFTRILAMDAYVPRTNPITPRAIIAKFLAVHRGHSAPHFCCDQKVRRSRRAGKMKAKALLAKAPMREMRSPRSGTATAMAAT